MSQAIRELFENTKIDDVPTEKATVIEIASNEDVESAFVKLVDNYVLSAPVFDVTSRQYIGFLDMKDLVSMVVFVASQKKPFDHITHVRSLLKSLVSYSYPTERVSVSYLARRNPFHPVASGSSLLKAAEILERRVHRVPVVDSQGKVVKIISQSAVVKFLHQNLNVAGDATLRSVKELNLGNKKVLHVLESQTALEAFALMEQKNVNGVAVVNSQNQLTGNVSSRDVKRFLKSPNFAGLNMPVSTFLKQLRSEQIDVRQPVIACFSHSTFSHAVGLFAATRLHHLYVVDTDQGFHPVGIFSLTDVIHTALRNL